ncbi:hypothetical protein [Clostridium ljungdahlii]|uniref:Uncharacterized protein n=1 Tax=Clostridium ljungdahlii (strain ATCC 55383 / DSM 13528 / PETC) TaxID=748727 RepID=D8GU66_CLOLD|nr:hypothetical protein [Clostridium ljungdahlii]ADK14729.1 hypothetical protein CLJU_c16650 [Clostridium ljungdahlii DSM 13528]OAA84085.1 hypothetical protein WX45_01929 [Clostridium ljungdahlii DSM 13528]
MADDRRVNMYFSERKFIDDAIYQYFKDMSNKQDVMKMVLYEYVKSKNAAYQNFVTETTKKVHENSTNTTHKSVNAVTNNSRKKHKDVTKKTQESHNNVTKGTPISENIVTDNTQKETKSTQTGDKFNADDFITEEKVENKDANENEFDLMAIWKSQDSFMNK